MTELSLYKYIKNNEVSWKRCDYEGKIEVIIFPYTWQMDEFAELLGGYIWEGGIACRLMGSYISIPMNNVCEYYGIDPDNVFHQD
ncbi:MAG: hypothetical protein WAU01_14655 [Saprospiraceae bacterium]